MVKHCRKLSVCEVHMIHFCTAFKIISLIHESNYPASKKRNISYKISRPLSTENFFCLKLFNAELVTSNYADAASS